MRRTDWVGKTKIKKQIPKGQTELQTRVYRAMGAASMCWDPRPGNQVFMSDEAKRVAEDLLQYLAEYHNIY
jgi:hypothetical protein